MYHPSITAIIAGCLLLVLLVVWWWRRRAETPAVKVDVRGTGEAGWWTLIANMDASDRGWDATEIHVTAPDEAKIIGVNEALGVGHGGGTTVFDEIDPDRISNRSAWSVRIENDDDLRRPPASATFLLYAPPSRESRQVLVRVHIRSAGYGRPYRAIAAAALLAPDA